MHRAKQRREGVAILNAGGGDLTFYRQAERIDGDMSFAALDFLAGVVTPCFGSGALIDWLSIAAAERLVSRPARWRSTVNARS